ncbi:RusA family crossover junction endodeoxyribonuclease [Enterococcus diestrammenae]|uniref:Holliday junction resolvase n=1 Tax=Enterococcus diestrammenae TaxID=1155073 RepID=A0ABV0F4Q8_9ENTE|nr:RusA family crossover junction endodeoxyribonuclease [Enterococcus diestrammenae]KAF1299700.1 crossover junction endodeoxyribonuclease RusA [Enterococcus diestrammenae]
MRYVLNIEPKPQSRPRFGNGRAYEKSDMTRWKNQAGYLLKAQRPDIIEKGAIAFLVTFYIRPPKSISNVKKMAQSLKNEAIYVEKRPDLDNYLKAIWDCSNGLLFKDDGQIAVTSAQKLYSLKPRIEIEIFEL